MEVSFSEGTKMIWVWANVCQIPKHTFFPITTIFILLYGSHFLSCPRRLDNISLVFLVSKVSFLSKWVPFSFKQPQFFNFPSSFGKLLIGLCEISNISKDLRSHTDSGTHFRLLSDNRSSFKHPERIMGNTSWEPSSMTLVGRSLVRSGINGFSRFSPPEPSLLCFKLSWVRWDNSQIPALGRCSILLSEAFRSISTHSLTMVSFISSKKLWLTSKYLRVPHQNISALGGNLSNWLWDKCSWYWNIEDTCKCQINQENYPTAFKQKLFLKVSLKSVIHFFFVYCSKSCCSILFLCFLLHFNKRLAIRRCRKTNVFELTVVRPKTKLYCFRKPYRPYFFGAYSKFLGDIWEFFFYF